MNYPPHDPTLPVVALDYDGVLASSTWPHPKLGKLDLDAAELALHYFTEGCEVVVFTARPESHHAKIRAWLDENGLDFIYEVTSRKPRASLYFDDRCVRYPL